MTDPKDVDGAEALVDVPVDRPRVRILPDGRMTSTDAATYLGYTTKTLASWRSQGKGPTWIKVSGRIFYLQSSLDVFVAASNSRKPSKGAVG